MRKTLLLLAAPLFLAACARGPIAGGTGDPWSNPLFTQRYYADLVDHFVSLQIHNDPALQVPATSEMIDGLRKEALAKAQEASRTVDAGILGTFTPVREETEGTALAVESALHLGTDFFTIPGSDLHVYVTTVVDPRTGTGAFPDTTASDLGTLHLPYGIQSYILPEDKQKTSHLTVVLYDVTLKRIHGFAQLRP